MKNTIISFILIALLIIADQILKLHFSTAFALNETKIIIDNLLVFGYIQNTGASFGLLEGQAFLFFIITILALLLFGYLFSKADLKNKKLYTISLILLISGTLGNALDRLLLGYVIDFIQIPILPIVGRTFFNLADALLNFGILLFAIEIFIMDYLRKRKNGNQENNI